MRERLVWTLGLVLLSIAGACSDDGGSTPEGCEASGCVDGERCVDGVCQPDPTLSCPTGYVRVEAGSFDMGSPATEPFRSDDEQLHRVTLSKPFCIKATEVTRGEFRELMGYLPSDEPSGDDYPVAGLRWMEAAAFCVAASQRDGLDACYTCTGSIDDLSLVCPHVEDFADCNGYRLPTEAEWEYAARAGAGTAFTNGDYEGQGFCESTRLAEVAWFCGNSEQALHPVGQKAANAWGLFDVLGNVQEWCTDALVDYPTDPVTDPLAWSGDGAVSRGGGFDLDAPACRLASRRGNEPGQSEANQGFRPVRAVR